MSAFRFQPIFELGHDPTPYRKLSSEGVGEADVLGTKALMVEPEALSLLASQAVRDVSHLFRSSHLEQVRRMCASMRIDYMLLSTGDRLDKSLAGFLAARARVVRGSTRRR